MANKIKVNDDYFSKTIIKNLLKLKLKIVVNIRKIFKIFIYERYNQIDIKKSIWILRLNEYQSII